MKSLRRAVFLDRDGVVTEPVWNPMTGEYESPHRVDDVRLLANCARALGRLQEQHFVLFLVSNQPSYAKGKVDLQVLQSIASHVDAILVAAKVRMMASYYCYHHPCGVVSGFSGECVCRKPKPYFLLEAARTHRIDLSQSWMVGDRDTDIECGRRAGCRTIRVSNLLGPEQGRIPPDFIVRDLQEAADVLGSGNA